MVSCSTRDTSLLDLFIMTLYLPVLYAIYYLPIDSNFKIFGFSKSGSQGATNLRYISPDFKTGFSRSRIENLPTQKLDIL